MLIGQFLREKRIALGFTQDQVAKALLLSHRSQVLKRELGQLEWSFDNVYLIAKLFDMKMSELIREWEETSKKLNISVG